MHSLENIPKSCALLELYINNSDSDFIDVVTQSVEKHNNKVLNNDFPDAGFDLHFPGDEIFNSIKTKFVSMDVMCQMKVYNPIQDKWVFTSYYLYPRSSLCKTPLSMANHVGIIDSGYRGNITGGFRNLASDTFHIERHSRLLQICASDLRPIIVNIINLDQLQDSTRRAGGFGSTGV
tara:strand:- start:60 stop:593 length:534 start_codon:yes stop_codon:yes gene_type:complete